MPDNYKKMRSNDNFRGEPSENKPATITRSNQAGTRTIASFSTKVQRMRKMARLN